MNNENARILLDKNHKLEMQLKAAVNLAEERSKRLTDTEYFTSKLTEDISVLRCANQKLKEALANNEKLLETSKREQVPFCTQEQIHKLESEVARLEYLLDGRHPTDLEDEIFMFNENIRELETERQMLRAYSTNKPSTRGNTSVDDLLNSIRKYNASAQSDSNAGESVDEVPLEVVPSWKPTFDDHLDVMRYASVNYDVLERKILAQMFITNQPAFEQRQFIHGTDMTQMSDEAVFSTIAQLEGRIADLKKIKTTSNKIKKEIENIRADIASIIEVLDSRAD